MRAAAFLLVAVSAVGSLVRTAEPQSLPTSSSLLDVSSGQSVRLSPDAPLLHVVFFATWCPPCRDELSRLAELEARWKDLGYRLVLVAVPERHSIDRLREFRRNRGVPGELLFDADGSFLSDLGAERIPTHLLVDRSGAVILRRPRIDAEIETVLQEVLVRYAREED